MEEIGIDLKVQASRIACHSTASRLTRQEPTISEVIAEREALLASLFSNDDELYSIWKRLEAHKEFLQLQEVIDLLPHS